MSVLKNFDHLRIPLEDIRQATNNFAAENSVDIDEYGRMYKGELLRPEGLVTVTFKRLDRAGGQRSEELLNMITILSNCRHENILCLVGFCDEGNEFILVQEFATHGSLDRYLSSANLTWLKRLQICLDAARGLNHLHNHPDPDMRILHRDLSSANILLDQDWHAKIANIGLSNYLHRNEQQTFLVTSTITGALGYIDPTYIESGILTKESDIYSFGIVLMEALCGRLAYEEGKPPLGRMASHHYKDGTLTQIIDPILRKQMSADSLDVFSAIAYQCLKRDRQNRPKIVKVVQKLEEVLELQQKFE